MLDAKGGLIGMLLFGPAGGRWSVPYETIERAVATLREKGHVARGYLGAGLHPIRNGDTKGAMVMSLDDTGPAKAAGLHVGDIVVSWNGEAVHGPRASDPQARAGQRGHHRDLGISSGGTQRDVSITIGEKPLS
ncbi:S1C family serine protease [Mesorhizobium atlanticum]